MSAHLKAKDNLGAEDGIRTPDTPTSEHPIEIQTETKGYSKLLRKVDRNLLPILTLLYLLSFLDRSNIGNARLDGLTTDLHVVGSNYNVALCLFFVGYVMFEVPSQLVLKKTNPKVWLPFLAFVWGSITVIQGLVHNQAGLFAIRFFLGVSECGLFPGCVYVFSLWYPRHTRHFRVSIFFAGAALAGAFGGILAYGLGEMRGIGGKNGWSWIFIIEGLITVVVAVISYFFIPASLDTAKFLNAEEKQELKTILRKDSDSADNEAFNWHGVKAALLDPQCWGYAMLFHTHSFSLYSVSLFAPTLIRNLGFAAWRAQLLSTPPYALAFICTMATAYGSYKIKRRAPFIIFWDIVIIIGYIIMISTVRPAPSYFGLFLVIAGIYSANALVLSWPSENISSQTKRATALGMQISIGNLGAITSTMIYRPTPASFARHNYRKPHIITLGYIVGAIAIASTLWFFLARANRRRDEQARQRGTEKAGASVQSASEERLLLGDRHPDFRYNL